MTNFLLRVPTQPQRLLSNTAASAQPLCSNVGHSLRKYLITVVQRHPPRDTVGWCTAQGCCRICRSRKLLRGPSLKQEQGHGELSPAGDPKRSDQGTPLKQANILGFLLGWHLVTRTDWMFTGLFPYHTVSKLGRAGIPAAEGGQASQGLPHRPQEQPPPQQIVLGDVLGDPRSLREASGGQARRPEALEARPAWVRLTSFSAPRETFWSMHINALLEVSLRVCFPYYTKSTWKKRTQGNGCPRKHCLFAQTVPYFIDSYFRFWKIKFYCWERGSDL